MLGSSCLRRQLRSLRIPRAGPKPWEGSSTRFPCRLAVTVLWKSQRMQMCLPSLQWRIRQMPSERLPNLVQWRGWCWQVPLLLFPVAWMGIQEFRNSYFIDTIPYRSVRYSIYGYSARPRLHRKWLVRREHVSTLREEQAKGRAGSLGICETTWGVRTGCICPGSIAGSLLQSCKCLIWSYLSPDCMQYILLVHTLLHSRDLLNHFPSLCLRRRWRSHFPRKKACDDDRKYTVWVLATVLQTYVQCPPCVIVRLWPKLCLGSFHSEYVGFHNNKLHKPIR